MGAGPDARRENLELFRTAPFWARGLRPWFIFQHRVRRLFAGSYLQKPFTYAIYTQSSPGARVVKTVEQPRFRPSRTNVHVAADGGAVS
jgi:hypothetical protein